MANLSSGKVPSSFHVNGVFCYGSSCTDVPIDWVADFDDAQDGSVIIVLSRDHGTAQAGVYSRLGGSSTGGIGANAWNKVMSYEDFSRHFSSARGTLKIITNADVEAVPPPGAVLYKRGQRQPEGSVITPSKTIWWSMALPLEAPDSTAVTKDPASAVEGALQISVGPRGIEDWVPSSGGLVMTDAEGRPSIAEPGVDYSLPTELVAVAFPTDNPEVVADDPKVDYVVGGEVQHSLNLAQLRSGAGLPIGMVVLNLE